MPEPLPSERVLKRLQVYRDIFFVVWDVIVPVAGAGAALYIFRTPELQAPEVYGAFGTIFGVNGFLRVLAARTGKPSDGS